jgi:hypothetical protein
MEHVQVKENHTDDNLFIQEYMYVYTHTYNYYNVITFYYKNK